jgi:hypothetical protein
MASVLDCYRYRECHERGREGENFLAYKLEELLKGTGLAIRVATDQDPKAPFDLEVLDGERILVGIENKDLGPSTRGTWIKSSAKRRKHEHARVNHIPRMLTTVTLRDAGQVGFRRGIEEKPVASYDFSLEHLAEEILAARRD